MVAFAAPSTVFPITCRVGLLETIRAPVAYARLDEVFAITCRGGLLESAAADTVDVVGRKIVCALRARGLACLLVVGREWAR